MEEAHEIDIDWLSRIWEEEIIGTRCPRYNAEGVYKNHEDNM